MKNYIYILVCLFIYFSCKSQEKAIEYENENLIIFKDFDPTIKVRDNNMSVHLLTYKNLIFGKDRIYSDIPRPMKLSFVKDKDTMNIVLNYGNWSNIYVKNFKFKKIVTPGEQLNIVCKSQSKLGQLLEIHVVIQDENKKEVASGRMLVSENGN